MLTEPGILLVDDDDLVRALIQTLLRRRGFHVEAVRDGREAVERLRTRRYGLVLLDLMMPGLDGYGVLREIESVDAADRPSVLLITAGAAPRETDHVVGVISKPFDIDALVARVEAALPMPPAARLSARAASLSDEADSAGKPN